ncbi:aspartate kinase [Marixanthomonas ophiurae]|uniref:Homoserine dehydrogenase n=1 Tax=Marixanthomonas ophiurae TaxID=387659 RepID=A0A3E1QC80_9FLAO|nr:aspartate kinase [Marixanthomonas ophiurae]
MSTITIDKRIQEKPLQLIDLENIKKKKVNVVIFGHGNVGARLVDQIITSQKEISRRRDLDLTIFAVANSKTVLFNEKGVKANWQEEKNKDGEPYTITDVIKFSEEHNLENLIAIDNTADSNFVFNYKTLVEAGFSLVSSNKIGNTIDLDFYKNLRKTLSEKKKEYLYETNVGAGLPLIDTIKLLHLSGENITRIKGVFSGSLSYIFNEFSEGEKTFSDVLNQAINNGFTEPDPREDLCGNDVGRKLLILARELDLHNELDDISIQNLIPKHLRSVSKQEFFNQLYELDVPFHIKRKNLAKDHVLRYIGDLHGDLSKEDGAILNVNLVPVSKNSVLGQLKGSDSIFEIYTESYGKNPIVIQGAGAGAAVTARGVFGDILRLSDKLN